MQTHTWSPEYWKKGEGGAAEPRPGAPHLPPELPGRPPRPHRLTLPAAPAPCTQTGTMGAALCRPRVSPGPHMLAMSPPWPRSPCSSLRNRSFFGSGPVGSRFVFLGRPLTSGRTQPLGPRPEALSRAAGPGLQVRTEVIPTHQQAAWQACLPANL